MDACASVSSCASPLELAGAPPAPPLGVRGGCEGLFGARSWTISSLALVHAPTSPSTMKAIATRMMCVVCNAHAAPMRDRDHAVGVTCSSRELASRTVQHTCPKCDCDEVKTPSFTWWGGALGAHVLRHRICGLCGFAFDGKTGASNRRAIVLYVLATNAIAVALLQWLSSG